MVRIAFLNATLANIKHGFSYTSGIASISVLVLTDWFLGWMILGLGLPAILVYALVFMIFSNKSMK